MESLPDALVQSILSLMCNAKDVASCNLVSKRWKESMPYLRSLFFSRNIFDNLTNGNTPDAIVLQMVSSIVKLEELVVYCPFSGSGLASWLSMAGSSLRNLELRLDNITEHDTCPEIPSKLDCIRAASNLESLKLWGVLMVYSPKWDVFHRLKNLEIVGARLEEHALSDALRACPNLTHLLILGCEGLRSISIQNPYLEQCKLDFFGIGNCFLTVTSSKLQSLEVQGCSFIRVCETGCLKNLSISNNAGIYTQLYECDSCLIDTVLDIHKPLHFLNIMLPCRESLYGRIWKTRGVGITLHPRSPMVLGCYKQIASDGQ